MSTPACPIAIVEQGIAGRHAHDLAGASGSGSLFRPRLNPRSKKLADRGMDPVTMYRLIESYLEVLPGAMKETELPDGTKMTRSVYTPHSLRATTATLLLECGQPAHRRGE